MSSLKLESDVRMFLCGFLSLETKFNRARAPPLDIRLMEINEYQGGCHEQKRMSVPLRR